MDVDGLDKSIDERCLREYVRIMQNYLYCTDIREVRQQLRSIPDEALKKIFPEEFKVRDGIAEFDRDGMFWVKIPDMSKKKPGVPYYRQQCCLHLEDLINYYLDPKNYKHGTDDYPIFARLRRFIDGC